MMHHLFGAWNPVDEYLDFGPQIPQSHLLKQFLRACLEYVITNLILISVYWSRFHWVRTHLRQGLIPQCILQEEVRQASSFLNIMHLRLAIPPKGKMIPHMILY